MVAFENTSTYEPEQFGDPSRSSNTSLFLPTMVTSQTTTTVEAAPPVGSAANVMSLDAYRKKFGRSKATIWRYRKNGWLKTSNFLGKLYVTREAIADFEARIVGGELAKAPHGCATQPSSTDTSAVSMAEDKIIG